MVTDLIPRRHLFGNPVRTAYKISPDGRFLSWVAPVEGVLNLWVGPAETPGIGTPVTADRGRGISQYSWTYEPDHLVYLQDADGDENHHVFAVDLSNLACRDLTPIPGIMADIAGISRFVRGSILVSINARDPRFHDLYRIDLRTGTRDLVEENPGFAGFVTDEHFRPRLALQLPSDGSSRALRRGPDGWEPWLDFSAEDARISGPDHLDAVGAFVFCRDSRGRDTAALTRVALSDGATTILAAHDEADIGFVLNDVETLEPLAYAINHQRVRWYPLDERVRGDFAFLDSREIGDWHLASRSEDDRFWVLSTESDIRPWRTYLYDRREQRLTDLGSVYPELDTAPLVPMRPVMIRSRDGLDLVSYLTRPRDAEAAGALVLLVHGGPWGRDGFGFNPLHQWLADRGYAALSVNFRASTGFGKAFLNAGDGEWGRRMDDDLLDAVAWAVDEGIADPARIAIMGGSYGGYATLAALARNPEVYACGIDIVGPANLETLVRTIPPYWEAMRAQLHRAIGDPDTEEGLALLRERSPVFMADRIRSPLLIAQGANDPRVRQDESDQMVAAMEAKGIPVTYLLFPDEGHGFVRPDNRLAFFAAAEAFLARHLGGRAEPLEADEAPGTSMKVMREG
ncbi:alpha/beta hydrolase family protein [Methylobacterium marchantiae]|uniref:Alpha/beta hydrolase family protein n=1 Tax=Methylobacterium marchantiae TaxID=600331 RepID=A0ABW3X240_9HYPH|nr:Dipeptidyl aminopeptidase BIII [Methylobacterium marchantiae]